eukprot:gene23378-biopygen19333
MGGLGQLVVRSGSGRKGCGVRDGNTLQYGGGDVRPDGRILAAHAAPRFLSRGSEPKAPIVAPSAPNTAPSAPHGCRRLPCRRSRSLCTSLSHWAAARASPARRRDPHTNCTLGSYRVPI